MTQKIPYDSPSDALSQYRNLPEHQHLSEGKKRATQLHTEMLANVQAYKKFAKEHFSEKVGFETIPYLDKDNYLRKYTRNELVWSGNFKDNAWVISATSGSTGVPYYFPRQKLQDEYYALSAENYLVENFRIDTKSTLYINAFPMGIWIGGVFTYEAIKTVSENGYNLSIVSPGINKQEVINTVRNLAKDFDQIIIGSYAPFLKDILDDGTAQGLVWKDYNIGFIFSAEAFSEEFRDYLHESIGIENIYTQTLNHYGTVDLGTMAHETPLSILVRRLAVQNKKLFKDIFGDINKLPTLAQYDPRLFYFEEDNGKLICSSYSGIPLFRYDLKDNGGVRTLESIINICKKNSIDIFKEAEKVGIKDTIWNLPFVFVYERSDFSVSFFAFQIYPETIRKVMISNQYNKDFSGKFTLEVTYNNEGRQLFVVHVEKRPNIDTSKRLLNDLATAIRDKLLVENSEYRKTAEEVGIEAVTPKIVVWEYEDSTYFKPGGKQKWVKK